jgi:hypothetical protein
MFQVILTTFIVYILYEGKKKGKVIPLHAMKALGGRGGIASTHS